MKKPCAQPLSRRSAWCPAMADATSTMLTSVLLKRGDTASPEVVARTRTKRDSLKAAEMRTRKPAKIKARPERNPGERAPDTLLAAALHIQQHARARIRRRTKALRKQRSRAARHIQRSVRTWFLSKDTPPVTSSILVATAVERGNEGDDEDQSLCVVCLERPRVILFLTCAHLCACEACASLMHACPLCRTPPCRTVRRTLGWMVVCGVHRFFKNYSHHM